MSSLICIKWHVESHNRAELQFGVDMAYLISCRLYIKDPTLRRITPEDVTFSARRNVESTDLIPTLLINGVGECKDIAIAESAWRTVRQGVKAIPLVIPVYEKGIFVDGVYSGRGEQIKGAWHCVVLMNGVEYDPNYLFGMKEV